MQDAPQRNGTIVTQMEPLEARQLLASVGVDARVLTIAADAAEVPLNVRVDLRKGSFLVTADGRATPFPANALDAIRITGSDQPDLIHLGKRVPLPTKIDGLAGDDRIEGGSGPDEIHGGDG